MADNEDQIDRRFEELIKAEYGNVPGSGAYQEPAVEPTRPARKHFGRQKPLPDPIEYFNLSAEIERAEPDDPGWTPPAPSPLAQFRRRTVIAIACLVVAGVCFVLMLAGQALPEWLKIAAGTSFALGLILLLTAIPKHRDEYDDDLGD